MTEAYPLAWPDGWDRTKPWRRQSGKFASNFGKARDFVVSEVKRLGGRYVVISSNIPLRQDGLPYAQSREPSDPGIAVYFQKGDKQMVFACDQYDRAWKNLQAIGKTIEAVRGIERWGASDMMERALSAFEALPPPRDWRSILLFGRNEGVSEADIRERYRELAATRHPDSGGSNDAMAELNAARDAAIRSLTP